MRRLVTLIIVILLLMSVSGSNALADKPTQVDGNGVETAWANSSCTDIKSGLITDKNGNVITTGFDQYGYNYQAHMFNGFAANYTRPAVPVTEGERLVMKWSDEWISNVDCNGDGKLDRGLVNGAVGGISLGWLTNHYEGTYEDANGTHHYTSFTKIVWTGPGSPLWGQYTIIEDIYNDPYGGYNGLQSKVGAPGFGLNDHWTTVQ